MALRVLLVDDNQAFIDAAVRLLEAQGLTVAGTASKDAREIRLKWSPKPKDSATAASDEVFREEPRNQALIQSVVRAHAWLRSLGDGTYPSVELLAAGIGLHPKVVRQALRLAFLTPEVTSAILEGRQSAGLSLAQIPKVLPLSWTEHRRLFG